MIKMDEKRLRAWEKEAKAVEKKAKKKDFTGWFLFGLGAFIMGGGVAYLQEGSWLKGTVDQSIYSIDKFRKEQRES